MRFLGFNGCISCGQMHTNRAEVCQHFETPLVVAASGCCLRVSTYFWDQGSLTSDTVAAKGAECLEHQVSEVLVFTKDRYSLLGPS